MEASFEPFRYTSNRALSRFECLFGDSKFKSKFCKFPGEIFFRDFLQLPAALRMPWSCFQLESSSSNSRVVRNSMVVIIVIIVISLLQSLQATTRCDTVFQSYSDPWLTIFGLASTGDLFHKQSACDRPGLQADSVKRSKVTRGRVFRGIHVPADCFGKSRPNQRIGSLF